MDGAQKCCVRACPAKDVPGLSYFSLPVEIDRCLKWLEAIGRPDIKPDGSHHNYFVCSIHFEDREIRVHKQVLPDTIPTRNVPRIRKGVPIIASTTASQTDFPSSDDDDSDDDASDTDRRFVNTNKRTFDYSGKVVVYKRLRPNRKVFKCSEIQCNDDVEVHPNDLDALPMQMYVESCNLPRDSINSHNRKIFLFTEEENVTKKNDSESVCGVPLITNDVPIKGPLPKVIPKFPMDLNVPINIIDRDINADVVEGTNDSVIRVEPVISNVSFSNKCDNKTLYKFIEWKDRTNSRRRGPKFDRDFKMFALNLHTINSRAYKILINAWKLPKENELKNIQLKIGTKFDERTIRLLSQKFASLSNEAKYCILNLYSKPLKPHLYYDAANDEIIGMHNVDGVTNKEAANYALVASVRGIQVSWHQPVAFSLISTVDTDTIGDFIKNVYLILKDMGLKIIGIVAHDDQHFWNYCRTKQFISPAKHFITVEKDRIFLIFDIPHILNRLRNNFIKKDFTFDSKTISWKYVRQVYDIDKEKGGRLLSKLTDIHMKTNNKENSLEVPCAVFSGKVSSAIHFYSEHGLMPKEAAPTAEFIKKLNDALDVLNRKKLRKLPNLKSADVHVRVNCKAMEDALSLFKKLKMHETIDNRKEIDTLLFFVITFKSLIYINGHLKSLNQKGISLTRRCYLEALLDYLKEIEKDAGVKKPSPIQFTRAFSKLFLTYLVDLTPSPKSVGNMNDFLRMAEGVKDCSDIYGGDRICLKDTDYRFTLPKHYAVIYVASYLIYKCYKKHSCEKFGDYIKGLIDLDKTKTFVHFEEYNKDASFYNELKLPSFAFVSYVDKLDEDFIEDFDKFYHVCPAESIYNSLLSVPKSDIPCECFPVDYMLKLFVRARIYQTMIHNTQRLKNRLPSDPPYVMEVPKL